MIVYVPEKLKRFAGDAYTAGTKSEQLISFVDLVPTVLSLAGQRAPSYLQGKAFLESTLLSQRSICTRIEIGWTSESICRERSAMIAISTFVISIPSPARKSSCLHVRNANNPGLEAVVRRGQVE